jgi:hypothetical protein
MEDRASLSQHATSSYNLGVRYFGDIADDPKAHGIYD